MTDNNELPSGNPRIGPTAHFTAQAWRRAGFDEADLFDTWLGRLGYDAAWAGSLPLRLLRQPAGYALPNLHLRHHWLEQRLDAIAPGLVVEIGAGLSPRGLVYARRHPHMQYVEVDLPNMVAAKKRRLRTTPLPDNYRLETLDLLASDFVAAARALARPGDGPCVVITEGVVDYLSFGHRRMAWEQIAALLASIGGGHYLLDLHVHARLREFGLFTDAMFAVLEGVTGHGFHHNLFDTTDEALALLRQSGFSDAAVLETTALDAGELPVPPRGRFFELIEAQVQPIPQ